MPGRPRKLRPTPAMTFPASFLLSSYHEKNGQKGQVLLFPTMKEVFMGTYGFIGTGNMAAALLAAAAAGGFGPDCVLYNRTPAKAQALAAQYGCTVAASAAAASSACASK